MQTVLQRRNDPVTLFTARVKLSAPTD